MWVDNNPNKRYNVYINKRATHRHDIEEEIKMKTTARNEMFKASAEKVSEQLMSRIENETDANKIAIGNAGVKAVEDVCRVFDEINEKYAEFDFNTIIHKLEDRCADKMHRMVCGAIVKGVNRWDANVQ